MNISKQINFLVPTERNTIVRERASGMYRLSAYYTAKFLSELPVLAVRPTLMYTIAYWMSGLNRSPMYFVGLLVILTMAILAQVSYASLKITTSKYQDGEFQWWLSSTPSIPFVFVKFSETANPLLLCMDQIFYLN